jgi:hypothetical protein
MYVLTDLWKAFHCLAFVAAAAAAAFALVWTMVMC